MPRQQPSSPKKKRKQLDFEDWYEIAKKYYEEHGDLLVPRIYEDEEGHSLEAGPIEVHPGIAIIGEVANVCISVFLSVIFQVFLLIGDGI